MCLVDGRRKNHGRAASRILHPAVNYDFLDIMSCQQPGDVAGRIVVADNLNPLQADGQRVPIANKWHQRLVLLDGLPEADAKAHPIVDLRQASLVSPLWRGRHTQVSQGRIRPPQKLDHPEIGRSNSVMAFIDHKMSESAAFTDRSFDCLHVMRARHENLNILAPVVDGLGYQNLCRLSTASKCLDCGRDQLRTIIPVLCAHDNARLRQKTVPMLLDALGGLENQLFAVANQARPEGTPFGQCGPALLSQRGEKRFGLAKPRCHYQNDIAVPGVPICDNAVACDSLVLSKCQHGLKFTTYLQAVNVY